MSIDMEVCENALDENLQYNADAFKGRYRVQLHELLGLSDQEIEEVCPRKQAAQAYNLLIAVVSEASRKNQSPAVLADLIRSVGDNSVKIAKLVAGLATAFA